MTDEIRFRICRYRREDVDDEARGIERSPIIDERKKEDREIGSVKCRTLRNRRQVCGT